MFIFASCEKDNNDINNPEQKNTEDLYAKTEYNLDMRDFAMAVNEAINANKSFRKLIKEEVNKQFDGDFNVLLTHIVDSKVDDYRLNENGTIMRVGSNVTVRELLNTSFQNTRERQKENVVNPTSHNRHRAPGVSLIDHLTEQYPNLQVAVPFLEEQLEDENYIPPVVFLPEEYDEQTTEYLPAIRNDIEYAQPTETPDYACIVISENERIPLLIDEYTQPLTPIKLTGMKTDLGISLSWTMPLETSENNTIGYKIYRKTQYGEYQLIYTNMSPYNRSYIDNNLEFNQMYFYYVIAYNGFNNSPAIYCNDGQGIFVNTRPAGVTSFVVNPIAPNRVRFRWNFGDSDNNGIVKIYQRSYYTQEYSSPFYTNTLPVNGDELVMGNILAGSQLEYRIERTTPMGTSAPDYDLLYMPHRDVSQKSSIYIKRVKHSDVSKIESWRGAPEYLIKGWRVKKDGTNVSVVEEFGTRIDCTSKGDNVWFNANRLVMSDWQPGFDGATWYDKISLYAIELDDNGDLLDNIATSAQSAQKIYTEWGKKSTGKTSDDKGEKPNNVILSKVKTIEPATIAAIVFTVTEVVGLIAKWVKSKDDKIGFMYLDYYENPNKTFNIPAENGGIFTMEVSDKP